MNVPLYRLNFHKLDVCWINVFISIFYKHFLSLRMNQFYWSTDHLKLIKNETQVKYF